MLIALWIVNILLALAMLFAGGLKFAQPKEKLAARMGWVEDFSPTSIKLIGAAEVLGALGLVLPLATGIAPILAPIAAIGLLIIMLGAVVVHARRHEPTLPVIVLSALAAASAVLGFLVVL